MSAPRHGLHTGDLHTGDLHTGDLHTDSLQTEFRQAMANLCAPVSIITVMDADRPHGTTVSAVMSLSMDPSLVAVALAETSQTLARIRRSRAFGVNVLADDQHHIAGRFATKAPDRFGDIDWQQAGTVPRITGSAVWLACRVAGLLPGGDHTIVVGEVVAAESDPLARPLTYHRRGFGTHTARTDR